MVHLRGVKGTQGGSGSCKGGGDSGGGRLLQERRSIPGDKRQEREEVCLPAWVRTCRQMWGPASRGSRPGVRGHPTGVPLVSAGAWPSRWAHLMRTPSMQMSHLSPRQCGPHRPTSDSCQHRRRNATPVTIPRGTLGECTPLYGQPSAGVPPERVPSWLRRPKAKVLSCPLG